MTASKVTFPDFILCAIALLARQTFLSLALYDTSPSFSWAEEVICTKTTTIQVEINSVN